MLANTEGSQPFDTGKNILPRWPWGNFPLERGVCYAKGVAWREPLGV